AGGGRPARERHRAGHGERRPGGGPARSSGRGPARFLRRTRLTAGGKPPQNITSIDEALAILAREGRGPSTTRGKPSTGHLVTRFLMDPSCPVCATAEIISGKWTLLVIRDLADSSRRYCELERSLEGISPRTPTLRIKALEECGSVERRTYPEVPPRVEYALTEKGRALVPLIEDMRAYGRQWLLGETERRTAGSVAAWHSPPRDPRPTSGSGDRACGRCGEHPGR